MIDLINLLTIMNPKKNVNYREIKFKDYKKPIKLVNKAVKADYRN